jgi:hypothetical protein
MFMPYDDDAAFEKTRFGRVVDIKYDLVINAALQESSCWQSTEGHPTFIPGLSLAGGIQDQPTAASVDTI